jgi:ApbE superfamily uncharacterized protein (UPF0280 family)
MYQPRTYRHWISDESLIAYNVIVKETDLYIRTVTNLRKKALNSVLQCRWMLDTYVQRYPDFITSLEPLVVDKDAPSLVKEMANAADQVGVGPMAAVAGAIAEFVGQELLDISPEVIVENGGDIFIKSRKRRTIGIYAGNSPLSGQIGLEIEAEDTPLGICTSSGTVGHSLSFGAADAVVVLAPSASLADATATAIGNRVSKTCDIAGGIKFAQDVPGLKGAIIIKDDQLGICGQLKITRTSSG